MEVIKNDKYKEYDFSLTDEVTQVIYEQYNNECEQEFNKLLEQEIAKLK